MPTLDGNYPMSETKAEETKVESRRVTSFDQLKPRKLYRLHSHDRNGQREVVEVNTKDFYIEEPVDPNAREFGFKGLIYVRIPNKIKTEGLDLFDSIRLHEFGLVFVKGSNEELIRQGHKALSDSYIVVEDPSKGIGSPTHSDPSYNNWVEEISDRVTK